MRNHPKFIANLNDKEQYALHMKNLWEYLKMGLVLKENHRVIECKQSRWQKSFIDLNSKLRADAKNDFERIMQCLVNQWKM